MSLRLETRCIQAIHQNRLNKIAIISLLLIILFWIYNLSIIPPTNGYEISIYGAYPLLFWLIFIIAVSLSICLTIIFILNGSNLWKYGLMAILIVNILILFLPVIRSYEFFAFGGSDIFSHLADSIFILNTGQIKSTDLYPAIHILTATLDLFGLHDTIFLTTTISVCFYLLYVLSLYALGKAIIKNEKGAAIFSIVGTPLLFSFAHFAFMPFSFAIFILPLTLYCTQRMKNLENKNSYYLCFIILTMFIIFCHPMVAIILLLILAALYACARVAGSQRKVSDRGLNFLNTIAIVGVAFTFWYLGFASIRNMAERSFLTLVGLGDAETIVDSNISIMNNSGASLVHLIEFFIKAYGPIAICIVMSIYFILIFLKKYLVNREYNDEFTYSILFLLSLVFGLSIIFGYFVIAELVRATSFTIVMATIICGLGLYKLINNNKTMNRKRNVGLLIAILCSVSILSALNVYYSPWILSSGADFTQMEVNGNDWYLIHENGSMPLYTNVGPINKYAEYFQEMSQTDINQPEVILDKIPTHFGYGDYRSFNQSINGSENSNAYVLTNEYMRQRALASLPETQLIQKQFLQEDFINFSLDNSVSKVYINDERELWVVQFS